MALKLNATREAYQEFSGRNVEQMMKLIADDRVPMNTAQLKQIRIDVRNSDAKVKSAYMDNYFMHNFFYTGDAVVHHPDGRVKIVLDSQTLRDMVPYTPRTRLGALIIEEDVYNALEGEEFKKGKLGTVDEWMSREDVKAHPVWKVLARDQGLLNDYTDHIFGEYQARFTRGTPLEDVRAMKVLPGFVSGDKPEMRAWCVNGLEGRSDANGGGDLGYNNGRLVGIAPEALSAPGQGASNIKAYTVADLQAVDKAMKGLEGTLHPDVMKPFAELRKKL